MIKITGLLFLFVLLGSVIADAGVKTTLTQNGLNYLTEVGSAALSKELTNYPLGAITGVASTPVGKIAWQLLFMQMIGFSLTQTSIEVVENSGLKFIIGECDAVLTMEWHYKRLEWPHVGDKGIAIVAVHRMSSTVQVAITEQNGKPVVHSVADTFNIGQILIKLHGGASWLYRIFVDAFEPEIRKAINENLVKAIPQFIDGGLAGILATLPMTVPIDQHIELNYALSANPVWGANYMTIPDAGEFLQIANPTPCPGNICPQHPTPDTVSQQMMQFVLSDFVPNSFTKVLFDMSRLGVVIRPTDVPSWSPLNLNTSSYKNIIPALYNKWPNHLMQIRLYCSQAPSTTFSAAGGPSIIAIGKLELAVIQPDGSLVPAFTLSGNASLSATVKLSGQDLSVQIGFVRSVYFLESSQIGTFPLSVLNDAIYDMFTKGLVPLANALLSEPIPLPTVQGITFNNPSLGWGAGYLYVSTDITLNIPANGKAIAIN